MLKHLYKLKSVILLLMLCVHTPGKVAWNDFYVERLLVVLSQAGYQVSCATALPPLSN